MEMNDDNFLAGNGNFATSCQPQEIELMHELG
jgi:hypothetical protein